MRIALIAPPFIAIPPARYGGTELFVAHLAEGLVEAGHEPVVYAIRSSTVKCEVRGWYEQPDWPPVAEDVARFRHHVHSTRAIDDAVRDGFDLIHIQDAIAVPLSIFAPAAMICTLHHPHEPVLSNLYQQFPDIYYVTISRFQQTKERMPRMRTIHHGIRVDDYRMVECKQPYLSFLGRIAPMKGAHLAVAVAKETGIPLKMAGEIQPMFRDYWEAEVRPHVDGTFIEYLGEADHQLKNELLGNSLACLFPIAWPEPFGLVMIEAMACGTPVLALRGGAVEEVVDNGVSGWICDDVSDLAARARDLAIPARSCRRAVEEKFSVGRMVREYVALYSEASAAKPAPPPAKRRPSR
jgi:glycosyltransferase involved in cell wall biosynthesis